MYPLKLKTKSKCPDMCEEESGDQGANFLAVRLGMVGW